MPDLKISQLPVASTPLAGTELVPIVQGGVTDQTTVDAIMTSTVPSGTANGVLYLNGSKVATSGSALVFDGSNFGVGTSNPAAYGTVAVNGTSAGVHVNATTGAASFKLYEGAGTGRGAVTSLNGSDGLAFLQGVTEGMRLTSTGLGIGTSSPGAKLDVAGESRTQTLAANRFAVNTSALNPTSTAQSFARFLSTGADFYIGTESSTGGGFFGGSTAYAAILYNYASTPMQFYTSGVLRATLDSSGNLGLGVTPSAWLGGGYIDFPGNGYVGNAAGYSSNTLSIGLNAYYATGAWRYKTSSLAASRFEQGNGTFQWFTAPSGTAGNAISFTQALTLDASGNLLLGGTSAGASSAASLAIFNGTAPTGSVTNGIILYAEDVSSSSELKVRDEAGNVTTLSPHNFSLIPEGPSEEMAWAYYSEKGGKRINVDMLKLARMVEKLTGEKLVYES